MFQVEFYEDAGGNSDVRDFLEELRQQIAKSKDARIQYQQLVMYIDKEQGRPDSVPAIGDVH